MRKQSLLSNRIVSILAAVTLLIMSGFIIERILSFGLSLATLLFPFVTFPLLLVLMAMYITPTVINISSSKRAAKTNKILTVILLILIPLLSFLIMYLLYCDTFTVNYTFDFIFWAQQLYYFTRIFDMFIYLILPILTIVQIINLSFVLAKSNKAIYYSNPDNLNLSEVNQKNESENTEAQIKKLKELSDDGIITQEEYSEMFLQLVTKDKPKALQKSELESKILKLNKMKEQGLITQEEYTKIFLNLI